MMIGISTLSLIIVVYLNFDELNAMHHGTSSSGLSALSATRGLIPVQRYSGRKEPTVVFYGLIPIEVWLDQASRVQNAYFKNCYYVLPEYVEHNSLLVRHAKCNGVELIAYIDVEGNLLGVRPPHIKDELSPTPTPTEWYIFYCQTKFRLMVRPERRKVIALRLFDIVHLGTKLKSKEEVTVAGIEFVVYTDMRNAIASAELSRPYVYKSG